MRVEERIFDIAEQQQGYFTAQQALEAGILRPNIPVIVHSGRWISVGRGIYRLTHYPPAEDPNLIILSLWSRNLKGKPQGVWSHDTALDLYDLCDVMPSKMHMTVPLGFRRRAAIPKVLRLHYENLKETDFDVYQGYRVTTPIKTLNDVADAGVILDKFILQALKEALRKGIVYRSQLATHATPKLMRYLRELDAQKVQLSEQLQNKPRSSSTKRIPRKRTVASKD